MAHLDSRGLPISTRSDAAAALYRDGVALLLSAWPGAAETLDAAIAADPEFGLARAARARMHAIRGEGAAARAAIETAGALVARDGTARERGHVGVVALAVTGRSADALDAAYAHLDAWPRDVLVMALPLGAFGLLAFSGMSGHDQARVDLVERHAHHFADDDWWFLSSRGWAHAENGAVRRGRDLAQRGFELRRENANGAHALSHAMFEDGDGDGAEALIAGWLPGYDRSGILHGHIAWHAALSALERGDAQGALGIYAAHVRPSASLGLPLNVVTDAVSLLWRLKAYGHEVPAGLWEEARAYASGTFARAGFSFADAHMGILAAATGDEAAAAARIADLTALVEAGTLAAGPVVPAICRAALAFAAEDFAGCARLLEPVAAEVVRIGGSGAQREMIEDTLLVALMRGGEAAKARTLLDRRLHRRPSPRDARWHGLLASA
ncbi:tetratricopeptide repeat protein 38 family protein [Methylobacterium terrae]|uniref:Tetratricopeptide repeat protein 38 n=1 Tax=Methylobacterium terrae TaxID=2202827 RepID=A0A2U8WM54_9HYPH|nr:tetratricopeptide repeat protein [Methylobacterium terrae]AWN46282.1 tetratricopeptide repeat protein 38 family protein [Methylobacterium terrae]